MIYSYRCSCGIEEDRHRPVSEYREPTYCECGELMKKIITAPKVIMDIQPYRSVVTGERIKGRAHHREHLKRHDLIEIGNENVERQDIPMPDVVPDIKRAIQECK